MLIAIIVIVGLSLLILGHEAGHFFVAKLFGLKVDEFGFGFPPRIFAKRKGETEYSLNWLPFGGFVKIAGETGEFARVDDAEDLKRVAYEDRARFFAFQPAWKRSLVILAGITMNFLIGWLLVSLVLMIGTPRGVVIASVAPDSPASRAGIKAGDLVEGHATTNELISFINSERGKDTEFHLKRGGQEIVIHATPRVNPTPDEGSLGVVLVEAGSEPEGFFAALKDGGKATWDIARLTFTGLGALLRDLFVHAKLTEGIVGPVGIFAVAEQTGQLGLIYLLQLLSLISINLAVINLIPFPALDGGRFFMILIEKIKGSPISRRTEAFVNSVGFAFLLLLMVVLTVHDITHGF